MAAAYDPVRSCSGGPAPGLVALEKFAVARWPGLRSAGIYACRSVRGGSGLSLHAEGRALDLAVPHPSDPLGDQAAAWLVDHADALGVQELIWNRRIWTSRQPYWRPYNPGPGGSDHTDHVHVGLAWSGARGVTTDTLAAAGTGAPGATATPVGFNNPLSDARDVIDLVRHLADPARWRKAGLVALVAAAGMGLLAAGAYQTVTEGTRS